MTETSNIDEPQAVERPAFYPGEEPDGGAVRSDLQIYAMLFGAQEVSLTLNFGAGGVQTFAAIHPQIIDEIIDEMQQETDETPKAA